jgi:hypothetical protein
MRRSGSLGRIADTGVVGGGLMVNGMGRDLPRRA